MIIEIASVGTKMPDKNPAQARSLPVDHAAKVVEQHPADSGSNGGLLFRVDPPAPKPINEQEHKNPWVGIWAAQHELDLPWIEKEADRTDKAKGSEKQS